MPTLPIHIPKVDWVARVIGNHKILIHGTPQGAEGPVTVPFDTAHTMAVDGATVDTQALFAALDRPASVAVTIDPDAEHFGRDARADFVL